MSIIVESSARLHLGFYNFLTEDIAYGSLGVAIDQPKIVVKVKRDQGIKVVNKTKINVDDVIQKIIEKLDVNNIQIEILEAIPRHVGLGSTTQTTLTIAYAITKLLNLNYSIRELAFILGRGRNSGIGIAAFERGGFIIDSGRKISKDGTVEPPISIQDLPKPIFTIKLPKNWYFIIFIPKVKMGLDERTEISAMRTPQPIPQELQLELYKIILLKIIPATIKRDIETFGQAITKLQIIVGKYFSKYQGGIFSSKEVEYIVNTLLENGAYGAGQSSWGPTTYGITKGYKNAIKITEKTYKKTLENGIETIYLITKARNKPANIKEG
ncbi:MAG: hypothetical protein QXD79_07170 [Candidatus Methanomethylicia archaeon]